MNLASVPDDRHWKKAYTLAMNTRDDQYFYENMAYAMEALGDREQELVAARADVSVSSPEFYTTMEELEAINDALYLLKAYYDAQSGGGHLNDIRREAS